SAKTLTSPRAYRDPAWLLINPRLLLTNERLRYIVDLSDERRYDDMTSEAFAQGWPGARGGKRHGRRCGPENWFFSREGRPRFEDMDDLIALRRMWKGGGPFGGPGWGPPGHGRGRGRARRGARQLD